MRTTTTHRATILAINWCGPRVTLLTDSGFVLRMTHSTLGRWAPTLTIGSEIAYDVDETTGARLNPRPLSDAATGT